MKNKINLRKNVLIIFLSFSLILVLLDMFVFNFFYFNENSLNNEGCVLVSILYETTEFYYENEPYMDESCGMVGEEYVCEQFINYHEIKKARNILKNESEMVCGIN